MSETVENPAIIEEIPGSQPLGNAKREAYAQARAIMTPRALAYREAGFQSKDEHAARGNAAKLERAQEVRDRIAWLCRQPEEIIRAKRERLEQFKWNIWFADIGDYYVVVERPILDKEGNPVLDGAGNLRTRLVQDVKPFSDLTFEQRSVIQSLKYTDSGRPNLELYPKTWADVELRKQLGIGAQGREESDEFAGMSLSELAAFIMREQAAIGIKELAKLANVEAGDDAARTG
jgi:hypothetical protein